MQRLDQIVDAVICLASFASRFVVFRAQDAADQSEYGVTATQVFVDAVSGIVFAGTQWIVDGLACEAHLFPQSAFRFGRARFNARRRHGVTPDKPVYPHAITRAFPEWREMAF
jgi:hypothetical protein